nr:nucleotidyltransferase family protein [Cognatishimia sp. F0-27]
MRDQNVSDPIPSECDPDRLIDRMVYHGVLGCLVARADAHAVFPTALLAGMQETARGQAFWELGHHAALRRLMGALRDKGIKALALKGTALAYSVYDRPASRARGDTDLLVVPDDVAAVTEILLTQGYDAWSSTGGEIRLAEMTFSKQDAHGLDHVIDLHWRPSNHMVLSQRLTREALFDRAVPLDACAEGLLRPHLVDALLMACYHRFDHLGRAIAVSGVEHESDTRLIWLMDVVKIAQRLTDAEWRMLCERALDMGFGSVCHQTLRVARDLLGARIPDPVLDRLGAARPDGPVDRFFAASAGGQLWMNWCAARGAKAKLLFLKQLGFPPEAYMRAHFGQDQRREWLGTLYLRRAFGGAAKMARRRG